MSTTICGCSGIRVWRGYRSARYQADPDAFLQKLSSVFIPVTAQLLYPLGLKAYFPAVANLDHPGLPDEVALVVFDKPEDYRAALTATVGKAHGLLHQTIFNFDQDQGLPRSRSHFPQAWSGSIEAGLPVYLFERQNDWRAGRLRLSIATIEGPDFTRHLARLTEQWIPAGRGDSDLLNVILLYEEGYLLCWEHLAENARDSFLDMTGISSHLGTVDSRYCKPVVANRMFQLDDDGIPTEALSAFDVRY